MKAIMIIDGSYLYKSVQDAFENIKRPKYPDSAFNIFAHYKIKANIPSLHLQRVRYHDSKPCDETFEKREKFLQALKNYQRFDVILGRCQKIGNKYSQKGVDVNMAIDIVRYSLYVDTIIVISGDSDLIPAISLAKDRGSEVVVYVSEHHKLSPGGSVDKLIKEADFFSTISKEMVTLNYEKYLKTLHKTQNQ